MKALLLFGIDHELKDNQGIMAYDIAERKQDSSVITDIKSSIKMFSTIHRGRITKLYIAIFFNF